MPERSVQTWCRGLPAIVRRAAAATTQHCWERSYGIPAALAQRATARAPKATLAQVADHIEHIRDVAGVDAVGLGSDFDGITEVPVGLEDVSKFPDLIAELLRRGWSEQDVKKVAGLNALRVLRAAERVAAGRSLP